MHRVRLAALALAAALASPGCAPTLAPLEEPAAASPVPDKIYPSALERRLARVRVGQSLEEARDLIGRSRVRRPGADGGSFPSPLRRIELETPEGRRVELEVYVVLAAPAEGCPDVQAELAPLVALDGEIAALDWDYVERNWRDWGGALDALREVRDVHECPFPAPTPP